MKVKFCTTRENPDHEGFYGILFIPRKPFYNCGVMLTYYCLAGVVVVIFVIAFIWFFFVESLVSRPPPIPLPPPIPPQQTQQPGQPPYPRKPYLSVPQETKVEVGICKSCGKRIPLIDDNCIYCGAKQTSEFEKSH